MNDVALYRKYRPQGFKDVLGQEHIVSVLEGAIKEGNITHAYLFAGSRGTGKTSIARIMARELGTSEKDMYEIDAASNRGIDDIRELRESVQTLPFESDYKVYIIDEVHMLTKEAFNALLKTLEEPPKHVIFILATTEAEKLPDTVRSRCQTFSFKKPTERILKDMVTKIAKKEGYKLEAASAELIALLGDGSYRDTYGVLQKIISSSSEETISVEEVEMVTGAPAHTLVNDILSSLEEKDLARGLTALAKAREKNSDMKLFIKLVLEKMRSVMLLRYAPDLEKPIQEKYSEEDFALLSSFAKNKGSNIHSRSLQEMLRAESDMARTHILELPLELALIRLLGEEQ